ncbi:MAG: sulfatase [Planctomycetota bacterium]
MYTGHALLVALLVLTCEAPLLGSTTLQDRPRPNVLFIAVDDLRPALGCYGDAAAITPNLDRLAKQGLQFNRAYCQVAVCNPSRASLMTGQRPDSLGVWTLPIHFREAKPDAITIPQWFRRFGYTAVSHGKIYHNPTPDPQSWSEAIRDLPALPYPWPEGTRERVKAAQDALPDDDWRKSSLRALSTAAPELADNEVLDGARTDMAIEDLRRLGKQPEPFFLALGFIRPHLAWVAPKKYWDMHDPSNLPVLTDQRVTPNTPRYALANNSELSHYVDLIDFPDPWNGEPLPLEQARHLVHGYYACVSYIDAQIGRLMAALEEEGLSENTIVVLWSDHGWKLGEYRGWGKMTNYEIDARVPLLISAPGMKARGKQTDQLVELLDVYPTLCDLAGIDRPGFVEGASLAPILDDTEHKVRNAAVSQYYRKLNGLEYMGYSIRTDSHRMIEWRDFSTGEVTARELYDHRASSLETENIADSAPSALLSSMTDLLLATHPRRGLVMTPTIHSSAGVDRPDAAIRIQNQAEAELLIYPISAVGRRLQVRTLSPGKTLTLNSKLGNVFVVESADGSVQEIHSTAIPTETITIKPTERAAASARK